jgi:hypothetical protein
VLRGPRAQQLRIVLQHLVELANRLVKELPSPTISDSPGLLYG